MISLILDTIVETIGVIEAVKVIISDRRWFYEGM